MWKTILRRLLLMIPQVIILSILIFLIAQAMPGDPFTGLINPNQDPAVIERMREGTLVKVSSLNYLFQRY